MYLNFTLPRYNLILFVVLVYSNIFIYNVYETRENYTKICYTMYIFISCFTIGVLLSSLIFIRIFPILIDRQQSRNPFSIASPRNERYM